MTVTNPEPREQVAFRASLPYNPVVFSLLMVAAILAGILIWGLLLWLVVRRVVVALSGWNDLARRYPAPEAPHTWHWYKQTVKVGAVRYRRTMRVAALPDGLYLAESGLLRHPPLRVPWREMSGATPSSVYGRPFLSVTIGAPKVGTLEFPADLYKAIRCAESSGRENR